MKYPLEEKLPYMWLALAVLAIFYGIYFSKMLVQKRRGIRTHRTGGAAPPRSGAEKKRLSTP